MKVLIGAAVATLLLVASAAAQTSTPATPAPPAPAAVQPDMTVTSHCGDIAPQPANIDGAHATQAQVNAATTAWQAWITAANANIVCRASEHDHMQAQLLGLEAKFHQAHDTASQGQQAFQAQLDVYAQAHHTNSHNSSH